MHKVCRHFRNKKLNYKKRRHLQHASESWTGDYNNLIRENLEAFWKDKVTKVSSSENVKNKYYVLSMFPYPSGKLHMGHVRIYTISDVMARYHRLLGQHVIHPMGWDSFGLPAENAAMERGIAAEEWTYSNIAAMKTQFEDLCCSFDWDREFATSDPSYFKWSQYIFLKMFEDGLVYQKMAPVHWDPVDKTVLADEQVNEEGYSWRSGAKVEKLLLKQWYIRTTSYFKELSEGLSEVDETLWKDIALLQKNWFGQCDGVRFNFSLKRPENLEENISVYTPTPEAIYGAAFLALSEDHYLVKFAQESGVLKETKEAVRIAGLSAVHPLSGQEIPVFTSTKLEFGAYLDAVVGIPCVNEEHKQFAEAHNISYTNVLDKSVNGMKYLINSNQFSGLDVKSAFNKIASHARSIGVGGDITSEKARDWLISRQRHWGTPIPIVHCPKYGAVPVPMEDLPVLTPPKSLHGKNSVEPDNKWLNVKCSRCDCGGYGQREKDTMDTFVDSSWYFLRFLDPHNKKEPFSKDAAHQFMPVDLYIGGKEHAILHLYYARFFNYFLHKKGLVVQKEPFVNLLTQGMVKGLTYRSGSSGKYLQKEDLKLNSSGRKATELESGDPVIVQWEKMSKSKHNGVDPKDVFEKYGCDTTRLAILANVAPKSDRHWSEEVFKGILRWQNRIWGLVSRFRQFSQQIVNISEDVKKIHERNIFIRRNHTVKEVKFLIENVFLLNSAISRLQTFSTDLKHIPDGLIGSSQEYERAVCDLIIMISPFAPMFASEMWSGMSSIKHCCQHYNWEKNVLDQAWPVIDQEYCLPLRLLKNERAVMEVELPMSIGKEANISKQDAMEILSAHPEFSKLVPQEHLDKIKLHIIPGYKADLMFEVKEERKKHKKAKSYS